MTNEIVFLDLFSGIGGFSKGFEDAGFDIKTHYFSEINEHAIANYRYNFKNAHYVGSVENVLNYGIELPNVITFGSPCQDFSIAGRREGLSGERSSLILEAITIVAQLQPDFFIWENVKGTFSSNDGQDFWAIVQAFANIGTYRIEWQLLNTLWALPQNRERIYLVGHLATTERSFAPLFPFTKNDFLFNEPEGAESRQPQTQHSTTINTGFGNKADDTFIQTPKYASTLTVGGKSGGLNSDMTVINAEYFGKSQQNRVYNTDGAMGCLSKTRLDDKCKIKVFSTQPRSGDKKKGGTGLLEEENNSFCIDKGNSQVIENEQNYRRFTEIEVERLQGFNDNWTKFGIYNGIVKEIKKTNRYNLVGNAVTKTFPFMIAKKIKQFYL